MLVILAALGVSSGCADERSAAAPLPPGPGTSYTGPDLSPAPGPPPAVAGRTLRAEDRAPRKAHRAEHASSQVRSGGPVGLRLPSGTTMTVETTSTGADGALQLPEDVFTAGWWDGGSRLGEPFGALVVAAHVDSFDQGVGPFSELLTMQVGQRVELVTDSHRQRFEVRSSRFVPRASLSANAQAFSPYGRSRLVLITCGGPYDPEAGGYQDNAVVVADPVSAPARR